QVGRAHQEATPEPVWRDELAPYAVELRRVLPGLDGPSRDVAPELTTDAEAQFRLLDAMSGFLRRVAERLPLALVLDDLHWADPSTLRMLTHVAHQFGGARMLVIGTYRDTDVDRTHPLSATLGELTRGRSFERIQL